MNIIAMTERMTVLSNNDNNSDLQCDVHDNEINLKWRWFNRDVILRDCKQRNI